MSVCLSVCLTEEKYGRESLVIPVDFSGDFDLYAPLADRLSQLDIGVLGKLSWPYGQGGGEGRSLVLMWQCVVFSITMYDVCINLHSVYIIMLLLLFS